MSDKPVTLSEGARSLAVAILLGLAVVASYAPSLHGALVSDDRNAIVNNTFVTGPMSPVEIFSTFSWWGGERFDAPGYRPLVTLSFALNHAVGGLDVAGYHGVNLLLHVLVCWVVYKLALGLGTAWPAAAAAAFVFALLPIHSEVVAWVVGRAEIMAAAGFSAAMLALLAHRSSGSLLALAAAAGALFFGLLSKENALTLLAVPALLAVVYPGDRVTRRRDATALAILALTVAAYLGLRAMAGPLLPSGQGNLLDNPLVALPTGTRLLGALSVLGRYLYLTVWPSPLSIDYSYNALGIGAGFIADRYSVVAVASLGLLGWGAWRCRRSQPAITFGILLSAACYSIVSNVIPIGTIMGERLFYLPSLGLCLAAGVGVGQALDRWPRPVAFALLALATTWIVVDFERCWDWRTPVRLFEATVEAAPASARSRMELASAYGQAGDIDAALDQFEAALTIKPDYAAAAFNMGNMFARAERFDEAVTSYRRALEAEPRLAPVWHNLSLVYRNLGRIEEHLEAMETAAAVVPRNYTLRVAYADALLEADRPGEAVEAYTLALELGANPTIIQYNRGVAHHRLGGCAAAVPDYLGAVRTGNAPSAVYRTAIACLHELGRSEEAEELAAVDR